MRVTKLATRFFLLFEVFWILLDQLLAFSTNFPREYKCCHTINWIQVIKILPIEDSGASNKCAIVVSENPLLSLSRVIYISSFSVNRRLGPMLSVFRWLGFFALSLPFESECFKWYLAGPRNVNVSNCSGKGPVKNFGFCLLFRTALGSNMLTRFEMYSSLSLTTVWFLKIIVSTLATRTYCLCASVTTVFKTPLLLG